MQVYVDAQSVPLFICLVGFVDCLLQEAFTRDGLSQLWNELVRDDEIAFGSKSSLINSAGVLAKKGKLGIECVLLEK